MNPVVLPGSVARRRGWLVYLLNPTNDAAVIVSGGHTRFLVSEDGTTLLETTRLSQCLSQRRAPAPGAETVETFIVTPLFDAPNEGHVFTAMSNRLPLLLATMRSTPMTTWKIRPDGVIEYLGEHRRPAADAGP